jgi:uncharacterized protein YdhG (YjbR/CyaY superfamily)
MAKVEEYLQNLPSEQQAELARIRKIIMKAVPDTEEMMSYGIPTFKYKNRPLIYMAAYKNHYSLYPASDAMVKTIPELAEHRVSKGTLHFPISKPVSEGLLKKIVKFKLNELESKHS